MIVLFFSFSLKTARALEVPLKVKEYAGVDRINDPVTTGIPLPQGVVMKEQTLRIKDGKGKEIPSQFRVLSRWPDGSIKWVLADFQATVKSGKETLYSLQDGGDPSENFPLSHLKVTETKDILTVATGALQLRISKKKFNLFDQVFMDIDGDGKEDPLLLDQLDAGVIITKKDNKTLYLSSSDEAPQVVVEEKGPMRVVIRIDGRHNSHTENGVYKDQLSYLDYTVRIHAYNDKSYLRVFYTLKNPDRFTARNYHEGGPGVFHEFEGLALKVKTNLTGNKSFILGGDKRVQAKLGAGERVTLYQDSSGGPHWGPSKDGSPFWSTSFRGYKIYKNDQEISSGYRSSGWGDLSNATWGLTVSLRHFWQNFPKGIELEDSGSVIVELFPTRWAKPHRFEGGRYKTHELFYYFHSGPADKAQSERILRSFQNPLRALAPNTWYQASMALGYMSVEDEKRFPQYEEAARSVIAYKGPHANMGDIYREREDKDEYGWLNFGDHYRAGWKDVRYWGNNEFDFSYILLLQYLRMKDHDIRFFENGEYMVRHLIDIDQYHTDRDLFWANHGIHKHDASGIMDHSREPQTSHFWIRGLLTYYVLTGDELALESAQEVGQWLKNLETDPIHKPGDLAYADEPRNPGQIVQALMDLYEVTGNKDYLRLARDVIRWKITRKLVPAKVGAYFGGEGETLPWQLGYATEGIGRYALTKRALGEPDQEAENSLIKLLDFLKTPVPDGPFYQDSSRIAFIWSAKDPQKMEPSPNLQTTTDGFAYGYLLTGRKEYWDMARETLKHVFDDGTHYYTTTLATPAKNAGFHLRFGQIYMGLTQLRSPDRQGLPPRH